MLFNMNMLWYIFYILFLKQINLVQNFNVDLHSYVRHTHAPGSMYGFSIAMHKTTDSGISKSWLIVGAPKANLTDNYSRLGLKEPGVVFRCHVDADNRCQSIPFDQQGGNKYNTNNEQIETKSWQWFGATVASGGVDKPIVACAPRYVFHGMQPNKVERIEPVGICFTAEDFQKYREYSPCRTNFWGYHRQGYCQAGFSAAISQTGDRLFIGAPGSWYWQGQVYSINTKSEFPFKPGYYQPFGEAGQIYSLDITANTSQVYSTRESSSHDDDSYLGYSMAVGRLSGTEKNDVAVGMPRGENLLGKIVIFSWSMENLHNITGQQIGAYFGYSLCAVDVNGDNLDDLIIGAPMFTEPNNDGKYDIGRVIIAYQAFDKGRSFERTTFLDGFKSRGRFGTAITSLNDINKDGYKDFAIGAPYDGRSGSGAVYIYHGGPDGPIQKPSQIIYAEDLTIPYPRTFGFSLSGGMDLDENGYPDIAVGAYESDTVFFLKSRPVVKVESQIKFFNKAGNVINAIDIEKKKDCFKNGYEVPCAKLQLCIKSKDNLPQNPNLNFDITYKLDAKAKNHRMFSENGLSEIKKMIPLNQRCTEDLIYITNAVQDKLTPMEVEVEYDIVDRSRIPEPLRREPRSIPPPIVDQRFDQGRKGAIGIQKNCGLDNVCIPDLKLSVRAVDKYILDDQKRLDINVSVTNAAEDAYETKFYMKLPKGVEYASTQNLKGTDVQVTCTAVITEDILKCDIGNPLKTGSTAVFKIGLYLTGKEGYPPNYDFYMNVNSTNVENPITSNDNILEKRIILEIKTDFNVHGTTLASFGYYKIENYLKYDEVKNETDLGPEVIHAYNFRNNGSAEIRKVIIAIAIPTKTLGNKPLMYVLNSPELLGNIKCNQIPPLNAKNVVFNSEFATKSYLAQIGATSSQGEKKLSENNPTTQHSFNYSTNSAHETKMYTEEERRRHEQDERRDSPGDASETHSQRANQASSMGSSSYQWSTQYPPTYESEIRHDPLDSLSTAAQGQGFRTGTIETGESGQFGGDRGGLPSRTYHSGQSGGYQDGYVSNYPGYQSGQSGGFQTGGYQSGQNGGFQTGGYQSGQNGGFQTGGYQSGGRYQSGGGFQSGGGGFHSEYQPYGTLPTRRNFTYSRSWNSANDGTDDFRRGKRQIIPKTLKEEAIYADLRAAVNCTMTHCYLMECEISKLDSKEEAWVSIRSRLVTETLVGISTTIPINVSTMAAAAIVHAPYRTDVPHKTVIKTHEIVYTAIPEPEAKDDVIPLWVVVLSACAGVLILLLLAFLLYKCGFFNRNRPSDSSERQPLNGNRGYHGDEHL